MNKEKPEWELAILSLVQPTVIVKLKCDDIEITFSTIVYEMRLVIMWYIGYEWKGIYSNRDSEIGKKFGRPITIGHDKAFRKLVRNTARSEAERKKKVDEHENRITMFSWNWTRPEELVEKLKSTCTKIEIIEQIHG